MSKYILSAFATVFLFSGLVRAGNSLAALDEMTSPCEVKAIAAAIFNAKKEEIAKGSRYMFTAVGLSTLHDFNIEDRGGTDGFLVTFKSVVDDQPDLLIRVVMHCSATGTDDTINYVGPAEKSRVWRK
jgi:hypothetical protein